MMGEGVRKAVLVMAETLAESDNALAHFTCTEADSIIRVVKLAGFAELAADLVICHARGEAEDGGDVEGDLHVQVAAAYWSGPRDFPRKADDPDGYRVAVALQDQAQQAARELARQYVAGL